MSRLTVKHIQAQVKAYLRCGPLVWHLIQHKIKKNNNKTAREDNTNQHINSRQRGSYVNMLLFGEIKTTRPHVLQKGNIQDTKQTLIPHTVYNSDPASLMEKHEQKPHLAGDPDRVTDVLPTTDTRDCSNSCFQGIFISLQTFVLANVPFPPWARSLFLRFSFSWNCCMLLHAIPWCMWSTYTRELRGLDVWPGIMVVLLFPEKHVQNTAPITWKYVDKVTLKLWKNCSDLVSGIQIYLDCVQVTKICLKFKWPFVVTFLKCSHI